MPTQTAKTAEPVTSAATGNRFIHDPPRLSDTLHPPAGVVSRKLAPFRPWRVSSSAFLS